MDEPASNDLSTALAVGKSGAQQVRSGEVSVFDVRSLGAVKSPLRGLFFSRKLRRRNSVNGILHAEFQLQVTE